MFTSRPLLPLVLAGLTPVLPLESDALAGPIDAPSVNRPSSPLQLELMAEIGFLAPLAHRVQFGRDGDDFDYVADGGQDTLFPFVRPTATVTWRRQRFTLLYQPLDLRSTVQLDQDLQVDDQVFPADRPIDLRYGFSFWRLSWNHQLVQRDDWRFGLGLGLQIRNANIGFFAADGSLSEVNRNIGPVPLLELEVARRWDDGLFLELEADGFWAPIRYINGGDVDVEGAIADVQVRSGFALAGPAEAFAGVRYIGGGASGSGDPDPVNDGTSDGYTENWLHFLVVSLGVRLR